MIYQKDLAVSLRSTLCLIRDTRPTKKRRKKDLVVSLSLTLCLTKDTNPTEKRNDCCFFPTSEFLAVK